MTLHPWICRWVLPALVAGVCGASARADVVTTFIGTDPYQTVNTTADKGTGPRTINDNPVGPFNFVVTDAGTSGLGQSFRSFCADYFQEVSLGESITYTEVAPSALPDINGDASKLAKVQKLFDLFYDKATGADSGGAFQLALWKLLYDPNNTDLSTGAFTAIGPGSPTSVGIAQNWLNTVADGSVADPGTYTLIGLFSATAQDQLTVTRKVDPVPAPAGAVLLAIGAAGLVARRRFAAKKVAEPADAPQAA